MPKKRYELRYNPDLEGGDATAVFYIGEGAFTFCAPCQTVEFGSVEEADIYLAASGLEKGEAKRVPPFRGEGVGYGNVPAREATPRSWSAGNAREGSPGASLRQERLGNLDRLPVLQAGRGARSGI